MNSSPNAEKIATAIKNQNDLDRARRVAARINERLRPNAARTFEAMKIYRRLHGSPEPKP